MLRLASSEHHSAVEDRDHSDQGDRPTHDVEAVRDGSVDQRAPEHGSDKEDAGVGGIEENLRWGYARPMKSNSNRLL